MALLLMSISAGVFALSSLFMYLSAMGYKKQLEQERIRSERWRTFAWKIVYKLRLPDIK